MALGLSIITLSELFCKLHNVTQTLLGFSLHWFFLPYHDCDYFTLLASSQNFPEMDLDLIKINYFSMLYIR